MSTPTARLPDSPGATSADEELARMSKALGHPVRAGIIRFLRAQDACYYGDLSQVIPLAKSTISQHLRILREAGLIRGETGGPRACYCVDENGLRRYKQIISEL
ncbi:MAG: ArsR/SmtB family transcription factor [Gemmatimonadota bacterium]